MLSDIENRQKPYNLFHLKVVLNTVNYQRQKLLSPLMNRLIEPLSPQYLSGQRQILN